MCKENEITNQEEKIILMKIRDQKSHSDIADELHISEGTVHSHFQHIYNRLGLHDSIDLMHWYCLNKKLINLKNLLSV